MSPSLRSIPIVTAAGVKYEHSGQYAAFAFFAYAGP
jgi:hypothetical protein